MKDSLNKEVLVSEKVDIDEVNDDLYMITDTEWEHCHRCGSRLVYVDKTTADLPREYIRGKVGTVPETIMLTVYCAECGSWVTQYTFPELNEAEELAEKEKKERQARLKKLQEKK